MHINASYLTCLGNINFLHKEIQWRTKQTNELEKKGRKQFSV